MPTTDTRNRDFDEDWDFTRPGAYEAATKYYAGPFCGCRDFSCAAMSDEHANCSTAEGEHYVGSYYPEHWTEEDIEAYELGELLDNVQLENRLDVELAKAKLA